MKYSVVSISLLLIFFGVSCGSSSTVSLSKDYYDEIYQIDASTVNEHWAVSHWFATVYDDPNQSQYDQDAAKEASAKAEALIIQIWSNKVNQELTKPLLTKEAKLINNLIFQH